MKIIIAGGRGFIGRGLAERLGADHTVTVRDLPEMDLLDAGAVARELEQCQPDLVVNLAAVLGGMRSRNPGTIFNVNVCGNINLVEQCAVHGVRRYVFASSLTVHGCNAVEEPCTIDSPFNPKHAYGASKAAAELTLMQYARASDMAVVSLRPTLILGDTCVPHAPIDFLRTLSAGRRVEIFGTGTHEREWIWIDDAVDGFARAIELCADAEPGYQAFFLGGNRIAMRDLALRCAAHLNQGSESVVNVGAHEQAFTLTCDSSETTRVLGWQPRWDVDAMIDALIRSGDEQ